MDILFKSKNLERLCHDEPFATRTLGCLCAQNLRARLDDLRASVSLAYAPKLPGRFHLLEASSKYRFAFDLDPGHQLVIEPAHNPLPMQNDDSLNLSEIKIIYVVHIGDRQ